MTYNLRSDGQRNLEMLSATKEFRVPAKLRVSLLGEVRQDVAVDVQAAEEGQEEMQEKTENREKLLQTVDVCNVFAYVFVLMYLFGKIWG